MAIISITDLYPSEIESLFDREDKEGGLVKASVNRALEVRGAAGDSGTHTTGYHEEYKNSISHF